MPPIKQEQHIRNAKRTHKKKCQFCSTLFRTQKDRDMHLLVCDKITGKSIDNKSKQQTDTRPVINNTSNVLASQKR